MEREQLKNALVSGRPIALEYEKSSAKYESAKHPLFVTGILLSLIISVLMVQQIASYGDVSPLTLIPVMFEAGGIRIWLILITSMVVVFIAAIVPVGSFVFLLISNLVGKILFLNKQRTYKKLMDTKINEFSSKTNLPGFYCNTTMIDKFSTYLDRHQADSLKECVNLFEQEERHKKMMKEIENLQEHVNSLGHEMHSVKESVYSSQYK